MRIIQPKQWMESVSFSLSFQNLEPHTGGYSFDCDENGNVDESKMHPLALENYRKCLAGEGVGPAKIERYENSWMEPAVGQCHCGSKVILAKFTNTCKCGVDYNFAGQALAPRSQWGEETGESWHDCY